uniref:Uncharacterized protein n=1 Tax=Felis catus TaxID=9685 RepID=A0ABI8ABJ1_FELCA
MLLWIMLLRTFMCKLLRQRVSNSPGYIPRCLTAGSYGNSTFNRLRNYQAVFQRGFIILHSHQQHMSIPISPHPCQYLLLSDFLIIVFLVGVRWCLICISLIINNVEHLINLFGKSVF